MERTEKMPQAAGQGASIHHHDEGSWIEKIFKLREHNTTFRTEVVAGLTTFLTMAYIIFVNPSILGAAGMPKEAVFVATCLIAALGTGIMALYANYPIALAPGMGLNAYFAFVVVGHMGFTWQAALGAVFVSGCLFLLVTLTGLRELTELDWDESTEVIPAVITALMMPFTYSIANGLAFGFISYAAIKLFTGRARDVHAMVWIIAAVFLFKFVYIGG